MYKKTLLAISILSVMFLTGCISTSRNNSGSSGAIRYIVKPPIEIFCDHRGFQPMMTSNIYGDTAEICIFDDASECLNWDYYMGQCKPGDNPQIKTLIYFANPKLDPRDIECGLVYPVEFSIGKYQNWERRALNRLLDGPTEKEAGQGYQSLIDSRTKLNSFVLIDGVLKLDFSKDIKRDIKRDCQKEILKKQLDQTMTIFGSIRAVEITIDGEEDNFLEI